MRISIVFATALTGVAAVALAQVPAGGQFQVNTYTIDRQAEATAAAAPSGEVLVTWESTGNDGSGDGVFAQRYTAAGAPIGPEFRVNSFTIGSQSRPAAAADGRRRFVVVWQSVGQDGDQGGIFGRRFETSGVPIGSEFAINSTTSGDQSDPSVTADRAVWGRMAAMLLYIAAIPEAVATPSSVPSSKHSFSINSFVFGLEYRL